MNLKNDISVSRLCDAVGQIASNIAWFGCRFQGEYSNRATEKTKQQSTDNLCRVRRKKASLEQRLRITDLPVVQYNSGIKKREETDAGAKWP